MLVVLIGLPFGKSKRAIARFGRVVGLGGAL